MRSRVLGCTALRLTCAALAGLVLVAAPAVAQRTETAADRCSWDGWLPPARGRARLLAASPLEPAREAALRTELRSGSLIERQEAALRLGAARQSASVDALIAQTKDPELQVVDAAIRSLGRIGDRRAKRTILPFLSSGDSHVRQGAAWALGQLQDATTVTALVSATREADKHVRTDATWALGLMGGPAAIARLVELTRDEQPHVRLAAVCSLATVTSPSVSIREAVVALRADTTTIVRDAVTWALAKMH